MPTVMIIDDQSTGRMILEEVIRTVEDTISVQSFADPLEALKWVKTHTPDLILTDYKMPHMDGVGFIQWLRQLPSCSDVPVVVITCVENKSVRYQALEAGATDFLTKPVDHYECRARCRNLLSLRRQQQIIKDRAKWLEREVQAAIQDVRKRETETLLRLARAGEYRDRCTGDHVIRIARYAGLIARTLGLDEEESEVISQAAPMHDIGKIGIPDQILSKPGKLTDSEWHVMRTHSNIGYEILRDSPSRYLQTGAIIAHRHHERFNGNGYPDGLAGEEIPLAARIVAVADVYDALLSWRPYKQAWPRQKALDYLIAERGSHLDPQCVDAFKSQLDKRPKTHRPFHDHNDMNAL